MPAQVRTSWRDHVEAQPSDDGCLLKLKGVWKLSDGLISPSDVLSGEPVLQGGGHVTLDGTEIESWDSALVCFLVDFKKAGDAAGRRIDFSALPEGAQRLVKLALAVPEREGAKQSGDKSAGFVETLGKQTLEAWKGAGDMMGFLGETVIALGQVIRGKARFRKSDILLVFDECGPKALPIVTLISFLVGMILAFVGLVQLEQFGADIYVANLVAIAMVREMGGMMTGIIMAGRTGAAFAAQLGTMQVNDEIAAFRTFSIPPIGFLVLPRMLALIVAVPLLTCYANVVGMLGGSAVTGAMSDVSLLQYYVQTVGSADLVDWASGLFKASVYGVIIAVAGCMRGIQSGKNAAAVGQAATSAVVLAIVMIIIAEAVLTIIYQILGI
jgi:phospholipid/cholesterol/gamma-HCH transport system permease protein